MGVFLQNAISPLLLVIITRMNGIDDSGLFSFAFAVAIIFWGFGMWGGRTYQVSDIKGEFSRRSYIMARIILAVIMIVGALLFSFANNYDITKTTLIITLVVFKSIESIADALYGIMQSHNNLYKSGKSLVIKAVAGLIAFIAIDVLTNNIVFASVGILLVNLAVVLLYDLPVTKGLENISIEVGKANYYINEALVIMRRTAVVFVVSFLAMFSLNIPRYFLDIYQPEEIGYFGILAMPITLIVLMVSFILQPIVLGLSELYHSSINGFKRAVRRIMGITLLLGVGMLAVSAVIGVQVLEFIFGIDFSSRELELVIIVAGSIANALIAVYINLFVIMRHFKVQFYILLLTNITLVFISAIFMKEGGLLVAVSLFTITNVIQAVLMLISYKAYLRRISDE